MAATIPIAKVSALLIRTLAKPVSTKLKREAPHHPKLSAVSQFIGQQIHSITSRVNVTTAGFKYVGVKPLPGEEALTKGINFISEVFIFSVAVSVVVVENFRSDRSAAIKKEKESTELKAKQEVLENRFLRIEESIREIEESLSTSSSSHLQKIRKLKEDTQRKLEAEERERQLALEQEKKDAADGKRKHTLPSTPRARRMLKAKENASKEVGSNGSL